MITTTSLYLSAEILQISSSVVFSPCWQSRQINILHWHCLCADFENFKSCLQRKTQATFIRINATFLLLFSHVIPCGNIHFHLFHDNKLRSLCEVLRQRKKHNGARPGSELGPALFSLDGCFTCWAFWLHWSNQSDHHKCICNTFCI